MDTLIDIIIAGAILLFIPAVMFLITAILYAINPDVRDIIDKL